jgi:aryl-alcohol dehydrogenase-like predicted oxidoreductase
LSLVADRLGIKMAQLSIAWCLKNPHVTSVILGATSKEQLLDNLQSIETASKLSTEIMQQIEDIVQTRPVLPEY